MRLTQQDRRGILEGVREVLGAVPHQVLLFGSRADPAAKGGDIDLLILCAAVHVETVEDLKQRIIVQIHKRIGERRVDITVSPDRPDEQSSFVRSIVGQAVHL